MKNTEGFIYFFVYVFMSFIGTTGAMVIPFTKVGCSSDISIMLNDFYLNGKENDLSALGVDFDQSTELGVEVQDKKVALTVGRRPVFQAAYNESIGYFVGLKFRFLGLGEIRSLTVTDGHGNDIPL